MTTPQATPLRTKYVGILLEAARQLHAAYPDQRVLVGFNEVESNGWQCFVDLTEHGVKVAAESFYINPPPEPARPSTAYVEQGWHTVETLRALAREQQRQITDLYAERGANDYLERIERTPNAWRIYGTIDSLITKGYDADHIVGWLTAGEAKAETSG